MTRKRVIKLLMGMGLSRNEAIIKAGWIRTRYASYFDFMRRLAPCANTKYRMSKTGSIELRMPVMTFQHKTANGRIYQTPTRLSPNIEMGVMPTVVSHLLVKDDIASPLRSDIMDVTLKSIGMKMIKNEKLASTIYDLSDHIKDSIQRSGGVDAIVQLSKEVCEKHSNYTLILGEKISGKYGDKSLCIDDEDKMCCVNKAAIIRCTPPSEVSDWYCEYCCTFATNNNINKMQSIDGTEVRHYCKICGAQLYDRNDSCVVDDVKPLAGSDDS